MKLLADMTEPEIQQLLNLAGTAVLLAAESLGVEKPHFALLLFNDPKIAQYCANCDRQDVVKALREAANPLENREDVPR